MQLNSAENGVFPSLSSVMIVAAFHWICQSSSISADQFALERHRSRDSKGRAAVGLSLHDKMVQKGFPASIETLIYPHCKL